MNRVAKYFEYAVFSCLGFVLTQALLTLILAPGDTPTDGNPLWRMILALGYLGVIAILGMHYRDTLFAIARNPVLVIMILFAMASCLWAQMPALVLQRAIAVLGATLFGIALATRLTLEGQVRLVDGILRVIAASSILCVILLPKLGVSEWPHAGDWRGIFGHKNGLGQYMAILALIEWHLPTTTRLSKALNIGFLLLSLALLYKSNSITSIITLVCTLIFIQLYKFARVTLRIPTAAIVAIATGAIVTCVALVLFATQELTSLMGRDATLTGRTEIWRGVVSYIAERPILGYGFSGFWGGASAESETLSRHLGQGYLMYSHNGYLDLLLTLGVVGFVLVLAFLAIGIKRAYECSERATSSVDFWPLAFMFFILVHNAAECSILFQDLEWALCVGVVVSSGALFNEQLAEEEAVLVPAEEYS